MADTYTPYYNLTKPEVGGDPDTWGDLLNADFDKIDTGMHNAQAKADTSVQITSGNKISFDTKTPTAGALNVTIDGASGGMIWTDKNFTPGNYLPLTGGTVTGPVAFNSNIGIDASKGGRQLIQWGDQTHFHVLTGDNTVPGSVFKDEAGNWLLALHSSASPNPSKVVVSGRSSPAYPAFQVTQGYTDISGRLWLRGGVNTPNGGGEMALTASDQSSHYMRARQGGGIEFINGAYNGVPVSWDDAGNITAQYSIKSNYGHLYAGPAVYQNDGNVYMPMCTDYLSNRIIFQQSLAGNGWIRFASGFTICWGIFSGTYWSFPRFMTAVWAVAGASNTASNAPAPNNVSNISNNGVTYHTYGDGGGWGICIGMS